MNSGLAGKPHGDLIEKYRTLYDRTRSLEEGQMKAPSALPVFPTADTCWTAGSASRSEVPKRCQRSSGDWPCLPRGLSGAFGHRNLRAAAAAACGRPGGAFNFFCQKQV